MLFRNAGGGGPWVAVDVSALGAAATGARVEARRGGAVLATAWAASTTGYAAGAPPVVHLGLGGDGAASGTADVEVVVTPVAGEGACPDRPLGQPGGARPLLRRAVTTGSGVAILVAGGRTIVPSRAPPRRAITWAWRR